MTVDDIREYLRTVDEVALLELLDITTDELLDAFYDKIEERAAYIRKQVER